MITESNYLFKMLSWYPHALANLEKGVNNEVFRIGAHRSTQL